MEKLKLRENLPEVGYHKKVHWVLAESMDAI